MQCRPNRHWLLTIIARIILVAGVDESWAQAPQSRTLGKSVLANLTIENWRIFR